MAEKVSSPKLKEKDVEWVVNDLGELGVRIHGKCFFLYKGESLVYTGKHDDGSPMNVRRVQKREFGESCRVPEFDGDDLSARYTEGEGWSAISP